MITLADVVAARDRIAGGIYESPCVESIPLSQLTGARIHCKLDYLQRTGSFKERGARNALLQLSPDARRRGVIAASAGNHAQGIAYHGSLLDIPVTVVIMAVVTVAVVAVAVVAVVFGGLLGLGGGAASHVGSVSSTSGGCLAPGLLLLHGPTTGPVAA